MTLEEIKEGVQHIAEIASTDPEAAHGAECALRDAFIKHVAEVGNGELAQLAREVLKSGDIKFYRFWP